MNYGKAVHEHYMVSFFTFVSSPWNNNEACSLNKVISYNRMKALGWRGLYFSLQARASTALWSDSAPLWNGEGGRAETALCSGSLTFEGGQGWKGHETMNTFRWPHRKKSCVWRGARHEQSQTGRRTWSSQLTADRRAASELSRPWCGSQLWLTLWIRATPLLISGPAILPAKQSWCLISYSLALIRSIVCEEQMMHGMGYLENVS